MVLVPDDEIRLTDLPEEYRGTDGPAETLPADPGEPRKHGDQDGNLTMEEIERRAILGALEKTGGNRTQAAELLGIGLRTLQRKIKEYRMAGKAEGN